MAPHIAIRPCGDLRGKLNSNLSDYNFFASSRVYYRLAFTVHLLWGLVS